jgi:hypothetical protein
VSIVQQRLSAANHFPTTMEVVATVLAFGSVNQPNPATSGDSGPLFLAGLALLLNHLRAYYDLQQLL